MNKQKKTIVGLGIFLFMALGISATNPKEEPSKFKNLKVLSKNITEDQLEVVMYAFERQLGVTCAYCHVPTKNVVPERVDFASDEKKEKLIAREMLKMTLKLNKKYFNTSIDKKILTQPVIWCKTCHHGYPVPHLP